ncbi:hypothetical protein D9615_005151 [Tricholomella constricta]|uniref:Uncharacterized protein n=1 Tax=Tricholomella constricta TaxID=117010 RepID=A0A8H5H657_9AGAR|nr:hypothetical protein D9615_005151 [Tricholomella constricta]
MSSVSSPTLDSPTPRNPDDFKQLVTTAFSVIEQAPPPTLREILTAYRAKGDGDRDMLLAMLNAKTAEDQRIASVASLQRTLLEVYQAPRQQSVQYPPPPPHIMNDSHHYPTPSFVQSPRLCDKKPRRQHHQPHHHHLSSGSRSPPRVRHHANLPPMRDVQMYQHEHFPRKRHRSSLSPPSPRGYEVRPNPQPSSQRDHLPPSPYSSSGRSDSAEYSPRSRASMAIGSLLSSGPSQEANGDDL